MRFRTLLLVVSIAVAAAACGGSDALETPTAAASGPSTDTTAESTRTNTESADTEPTDAASAQSSDEEVTDAQESVDELTETLEEVQAATGGGTVLLTVGDQSWTFDSVNCAFGEEEIGQEGAVFVLSSLQDGMQMYFDITESWGHSASLNDVTDFANPSVSLDSTGPFTDITLDGKSFTGTGEFLDNTSEAFDRTPGTFSGTCP